MNRLSEKNFNNHGKAGEAPSRRKGGCRKMTESSSEGQNSQEGRNLHSKELFLKYYSDRDWNAYRLIF